MMVLVEKWRFGIEGKPLKASKNRGETPKNQLNTLFEA